MNCPSRWMIHRNDNGLIINMMEHSVEIEDIRIGDGAPLVLIAGPCVIEDFETTFHIASYLKNLTRTLGVPFILKRPMTKPTEQLLIPTGDPEQRRG